MSNVDIEENSVEQAVGNVPPVDKKSKKPLSKKGKIILIAVVSVLVIAIATAVGYVVKANQYEDKFLPNTVLQGTDVSDMTIEEAHIALTSNMDDLSITITDPFSDDIVITGEDIALKIDDNTLSTVLDKQNKWDWLSHSINGGESESVGVTYDIEKVNAIANQHPSVIGQDRVGPMDTIVSYDNGEFVASGEASGTKADPEKITELISAAVSNGGGTVDVSTLFAAPRWTKDSPEIQDAIAQLNAKLDKSISYNIDKIPNAETLTKDQIASFMTVDTTDPTQVSVTANEDAITVWLREIGKKYDTSGQEKTYTTPYGKTVTVSGGTYGWITDEAAMLPLVVEDIMSDEKQLNRDFTYQQEARGPKGEGLSEVGSSYVDIDKTQQMVRVIKDNQVVFEARCVTGTNTPKRNTPEGFWTVLDKQRDYTMTGEIVPSTGKPEYVTKTCTWIRFTWSGCGMHCSDHGARTDWRVNAWQTNGSHGCANMHHGDVDKVYGMVEVGLPVIVHM